jgi:4-hydroxy-tetrahydrodipicolinate synthase
VPGIVGIKEATGDLDRLRRIRESCGPDFALYSGDDATAREFCLQGGHGAISVTANVAPRLMHEMITAAVAGDAVRAAELDARLEALHRDLFIESNPIPVKWAVHEMGLIKTGIRLPLTWLSADCRDAVRRAMRQAEST